MTDLGPVTLIAEVEIEGGNRKVPLILDGSMTTRSLPAASMRALAAQHPILAGRPIVRFEYPGARHDA